MSRDSGNIVDLGAYRCARRNTSGRRAHPTAREEWHARVYVDLDSSGHLSYGMSKADRDNALYLLQPTLYLADQLLKIFMQD